MKASELVKRLQEIIEDHGDCDVCNYYDDILCAVVYVDGEDYISLDFEY